MSRVLKIFFRLPRIGIITAPIDQKFDIVPSVNSLVLYLLDDPLLVGSFEFSSQPLFEEELVAHYTRIWRYAHSHGKGGEILKMVYEMRWNQITLRGGQCNTYRFIILHKSFKLAQVAFIMHVVVVLVSNMWWDQPWRENLRSTYEEVVKRSGW